MGFVGTIAQTGLVTSSHYLLPTASNHQITVIPRQPVWQKQNMCILLKMHKISHSCPAGFFLEMAGNWQLLKFDNLIKINGYNY